MPSLPASDRCRSSGRRVSRPMPDGRRLDEAVLGRMGRSAVQATVDVEGTSVTIVTAHFKSKLITYDRRRGAASGGTSSPPNDEGERLRYAGYAVFRRAERGDDRPAPDSTRCSPTSTLRPSELGRRTGRRVLRRPERRADGGDDADRGRPGRLGDRLELRLRVPAGRRGGRFPHASTSLPSCPPDSATPASDKATARPHRPHPRLASPRQPGQRAHGRHAAVPTRCRRWTTIRTAGATAGLRTTPPCSRRSPCSDDRHTREIAEPNGRHARSGAGQRRHPRRR